MSFKDLVHYLRARFAVEEGQTMAEYGVVLAVIAVAVVVALGLLSTSISAAFDAVRTKLVTALAPFSEKRVNARNELPLTTASVTVLSGFT